MRRFLVSGTLAVSGIWAQLASDFGGLTSDIVQNVDFPAGQFWTGWSEWYGCAESTSFGVVVKPDISTKQEFCSYPGHTQLNSVRYRECVLSDGFKYPNNVAVEGEKEHRYHGFVGDKDFETLHFANQQPLSGHPNQGSLLDMLFSNGNLGEANKGDVSKSCEFSETKQQREHCQSASTNIRCDPRLAIYAERHTDMTVDDVFDHLVVYNTAEVRAAIPEPYLTYQVQEAICPSNCPVPLPWTSWSCHCDQGSTASDNDIDASTEEWDVTNGWVHSSTNRNPDNLPPCNCGKVNRRRYQLCYDDDSTDDVTCESLGQAMLTGYPDICHIDDTGPSQDWFRQWYETDSISDVTGFDSDATNWFNISQWVNSRNMDTPWRNFQVNTDELVFGSSGVVSFLGSEFDGGITVDDAGMAVDDLDSTAHILNNIYRESVVNTWAMDGTLSPYVTESFDVGSALLNPFYNTYPKYNILNGARNGCDFKAMGAAEGGFGGFFTADGISESDFTFERFENAFQSCVWDSYFVEYADYRAANVHADDGSENYIGIMNTAGDMVWDTNDFSFIESFIQDAVDTLAGWETCDDAVCEETVTAECAEPPCCADPVCTMNYDVDGLWGFDHTDADFALKVGVLRNHFWETSGQFNYWLGNHLITTEGAPIGSTRDKDWDDETITNMEEMMNFMMDVIQQGISTVFEAQVFVDDAAFGSTVNRGWTFTGVNWNALFNTLDNRRAFTNSVINLIIDPAEQFVEISVPSFMAKLQARNIVINLNSKDEGARRWMEDGGRVQEQFTDFGLYNMTAIMWAEQERIREAEADDDMENLLGWRDYNIHPSQDSSDWTTNRPHNKMEYNYNEDQWNLNFERRNDNVRRNGYGHSDGYEYVRLTGSYPDACWNEAGVGEYVVPFAYKYSDYGDYEVRYALQYDDNVLRLYHSDMTMRQSMIRFIRNRFTSMEVGYQEETCTSTTGGLGDWGAWGDCDVECGTGTQHRAKECWTPDEVPRKIVNNNDGVGWVPFDLSEWGTYDATCQCEPGEWEEDRECFAGCTYENWSLWRTDANGASCFLTGKWTWGDDGGSAPPSCVQNGEINAGKRFRTRDLTCGNEDQCCEKEHSDDCVIPYCSGWKEWGSWSQCSVSCGDGHVGTKMRTRDCFGMGTDVGVTDECPCHATFAIDQCPFPRGDDCDAITESGASHCGPTEDDGCTNYYRDNWWSLGGTAHDNDDPGYLEIRNCPDVEAPWHMPCPYLRRSCQEDHTDSRDCDENGDELWWSDWTGCSASCGTGSRRRSRECMSGNTVTDWLGSVAGCRDGIVRELEYCNEHDCPALGHWSEWTDCSENCGDEGVRTRGRDCTYGVADEDGNLDEDARAAACLPYADQLEQSEDCRRVPCPVLSDWSVGTECSQACAQRQGYSKFTRSCLFGDESECGCVDGICEDNFGMVRYERCNMDIGCPFWGSWNGWSECITDSEGVQLGHSRTRFCYDPEHPDDPLVTGQRECQEHDHEEVVPCYDMDCPVDESASDDSGH